MVRLAVKIAEKIIGEELRTRPETIVSIARECLRGVRHEHSLTLRVNPEDRRTGAARSRVPGESSRGRAAASRCAGCAVGPGGCIVESVVGGHRCPSRNAAPCLEEILLRVAVRR